MTASVDLTHPSIHLRTWPPFLDLVLGPLPSLKASLFILGGLCSAMGCGHEANTLIRAFSSGVSALSTSQLDSSATVTHTAFCPHGAFPGITHRGGSGTGVREGPPPVRGGVLPGRPAWCMVPATSFAFSLPASPPDGSGCNSPLHSFITSFLHSPHPIFPS